MYMYMQLPVIGWLMHMYMYMHHLDYSAAMAAACVIYYVVL